MGTHLNSMIAGAMTRIAQRPAIGALTPDDFKVCEECGTPAMIHPRLELGTSDSSWHGPRKILCCACLHNATQPASAKPRPRLRSRHRSGDQIWQCCICETERAWGMLAAPDAELVPALMCERCKTSKRHIYLRVA